MSDDTTSRAPEANQPRHDDRGREIAPTPPERAEEPDFDDDDEAAMDRVFARLDAGETLDEVSESDDDDSEPGDDA